MLYKRGKIFWYKFKYRGQLIRESSNSPMRAVAARIERERRRNLELGTAGLKHSRGPQMLSRAVNSYLREHEPHWAERTRGIHQNSWRHLEPVFGGLLLEDIRPEHISKYQRLRQKENASGRSINIEIGLIRAVLVRHRMWANLQPDTRMLREREDVGRAVTPDEEHRLLVAARKSASRSLYPAIVLSIHTGTRNAELRDLRWRQVDFLKQEIVIGKSKTQAGEGRVIPLSQTALQCMTDWRGLFPDAKPEHYVFPSERYGLHGKKGTFGGTVQVYDYDPQTSIAGWKSSWTTCRKRAGVSCRWHDMRHTFISHMAEGLASDTTIMAMAGQVSKKTMERYSHVRMEAKRRAIQTLDAREGAQIWAQPEEAKRGGTA